MTTPSSTPGALTPEQQRRYQELVAAGLPAHIALLQVMAGDLPRPSDAPDWWAPPVGEGGPPSPQGGAPSPVPTAQPTMQTPMGLPGLPMGSDLPVPPGGIDWSQFGPTLQDPHTGGIVQEQIPQFLRDLSQTTGGRRSIYDATADTGSLSGPAADFIDSRFAPLEAQFVAEAVGGAPGQGPGAPGDFAQWLGANPTAPDAQGWRDLFSPVRQAVDQPPQVSGFGMGMAMPGGMGPEDAAYEALKESALNILLQAAQANVHPALAPAAGRVIGRDYEDWSSVLRGAPSNQAEFVREQYPRWEDILGR